ncbi:MAG TPA: DUF1697 domain-containing protein [Candidatus Acidoferrales bacterium]|nr:DUF1697 domain-containing protein [Candidatus Acidoferrales bacterium]
MARPSITFVALLRGINVGGNALKMDRLRVLCSELGGSNVRTYAQSGNLVFAASGSATGWAQRLEERLAGESRLPISVIVRTAEEFAAIRAGNPFLKEPNIEIARLAVTFLQQTPTGKALAALRAIDTGPERFRVSSRELYLHCPNGFGNARLYMLDKVLGQKTTVRNWNTVVKLYEMSAERQP